jgi:hypothetical protein
LLRRVGSQLFWSVNHDDVAKNFGRQFHEKTRKLKPKA